jgi:hypothetical protein
MKRLKAVRYFVSDLGIKEVCGGWMVFAWLFFAVRLVIIHICDASIKLWEPDWEAFDGGS